MKAQTEVVQIEFPTLYEFRKQLYEDHLHIRFVLTGAADTALARQRHKMASFIFAGSF